MAREGARVDVEPWIRRKEGEALVHPTPAFWDWALGSLYGERRRGALLASDAEGREGIGGTREQDGKRGRRRGKGR